MSQIRQMVNTTSLSRFPIGFGAVEFTSSTEALPLPSTSLFRLPVSLNPVAQEVITMSRQRIGCVTPFAFLDISKTAINLFLPWFLPAKVRGFSTVNGRTVYITRRNGGSFCLRHRLARRAQTGATFFVGKRPVNRAAGRLAAIASSPHPREGHTLRPRVCLLASHFSASRFSIRPLAHRLANLNPRPHCPTASLEVSEVSKPPPRAPDGQSLSLRRLVSS